MDIQSYKFAGFNVKFLGFFFTSYWEYTYELVFTSICHVLIFVIFLVFDAEKISVECINKVLSVCGVLYQDISQLNDLYLCQVSADNNISYPDAYDTSDFVIKNHRNRLEDKHVIVQNTAHLFGLEVRFIIYGQPCQ